MTHLTVWRLEELSQEPDFDPQVLVNQLGVECVKDSVKWIIERYPVDTTVAMQSFIDHKQWSMVEWLTKNISNCGSLKIDSSYVRYYPDSLLLWIARHTTVPPRECWYAITARNIYYDLLGPDNLNVSSLATMNIDVIGWFWDNFPLSMTKHAEEQILAYLRDCRQTSEQMEFILARTPVKFYEDVFYRLRDQDIAKDYLGSNHLEFNVGWLNCTLDCKLDATDKCARLGAGFVIALNEPAPETMREALKSKGDMFGYYIYIDRGNPADQYDFECALGSIIECRKSKSVKSAL